MPLSESKRPTPKSTMTLDRVLSRFGLASRAEARSAILAGRLKVNGRRVQDPDLWVPPEQDVNHLDGERVQPPRKLYLALYKPKGVITSHGDPAGSRTVYCYLGENANWVVPVGALDKDSSGLLLLTNDTAFADRVTVPRSRLTKTCVVRINGI